MNMLIWTEKGSDGYYSNAYIDGHPVEFHVSKDGTFTGISSKWNQNTRNSTPEVIISGKNKTADEAIRFITKYWENKTKPVDTFKGTPLEDIPTEEIKEVPSEPEVITEATEVVENPVVEPVEEVVEPVVEESTPETLVEENIGDPNDLSSAEETDVVEDENPTESKISFIVDENTMSIRSSIEGVIKYTTNGKDVNVSSKIYREPFSLEGVETVKVKVFDAEKNVLCEDIWVNSTN